MISSGTSPDDALASLQRDHLDLLKGVLTRAVFEDSDEILGLDTAPWRPRSWKRRAGDLVGARLRSRGIEVSLRRSYDATARASGRDWPARAETMIGLKRLDNLQECLTTAIEEGVPGDFIETGVWRGGSCIFAKAVLRAYGARDRAVWVADSFEGLPAPNADKYPADQGMNYHEMDALAVSLEQVRHNFARYGLLDDNVKFLKGWFSNTLAAAPIEQLAVLRLDGDLYESTMDALVPLYPKLSEGGYCIVDDYGDNPTCEKAITDYRREHAITDPIVDIDGRAVYWRRSAAVSS